MRAMLCTFALGLLAAPAAAGSLQEQLPAGRPLAAELAAHSFVDLDGEASRWDELSGEVVLLNFWASWCPPCLEELPVLDRWQRELGGRGLRVLALSVDQRATPARRFVQRAGIDLPVYLDGTGGLAATLELPALPASVLLDRDGTVLATSPGADPQVLAELRTRIDAALAATTGDANRPGSGR